MKNNTLECPKCGESINVSEVLASQVEARLEKEFAVKDADRVREIEHQLRMSIHEELGVEVSELKKEVEEKSLQLRDLNKTRAEVERLKREKEELRDEIALEKEREFSEQLKTERNRIQSNLEEEYTFKMRELEKQLEDQKELAAEMKRKAEQGSVQLQGEVQEVEIENVLRDLYVYDEITEVKKGQRGADTIQCVRNSTGTECGKIYYESKRTKTFDAGWIKKFRQDNEAVKADVLVLVTEALPDGCEDYMWRDGVWICSFWHLKSLSLVLRHGLLAIYEHAQVQSGRETKAEMLYNFLTGPEFKHQFEAILEGFKSIQDGYSKEKLQITKIWKEREKQLDRILTSAAGFYGSIRGIAGAVVPEMKLLEPGEDETKALAAAGAA